MDVNIHFMMKQCILEREVSQTLQLRRQLPYQQNQEIYYYSSKGDGGNDERMKAL